MEFISGCVVSGSFDTSGDRFVYISVRLMFKKASNNWNVHMF
jgi:hypothetical protein